jgi:hypothetical protein
MYPNPDLIADPPGVVIVISPPGPEGITAVILVGDSIEKAAKIPPNFTSVASEKLVPRIVTFSPLAAEAGVKDVIEGAEINVKPPNVICPPGVVTDTLPLAPVPTIALMLIAEFITKDFAGTPPKLTAVVPVKLVPVISTVAPCALFWGLKEVMVGGDIKIKPERLAVPPKVVTETFPVAPAPTTAVILDDEFTIKDLAATPPKLTFVAPVKFDPVIITEAPAKAELGVNEEISGVETPILFCKTEIEFPE